MMISTAWIDVRYSSKELIISRFTAPMSVKRKPGLIEGGLREGRLMVKTQVRRPFARV